MDYMVNNLCIVQARLTSTRLPNKVLMELGNSKLSILEHVYMRLKMSREIDEITFAIPDTPLNDQLAEFLKKKNINFFRGDEEDVLSRYYNCAIHYNPHLIIRATCDNPCVDWHLVDEMIQAIENADYMYSSTSPLGTSVEVFKMSALIDAYYNAKSKEEREHVCPYIINNSQYVYKEYPGNNLNYRLTVDEENDFKLMNEIYMQLYKGKPISNEDIYRFLAEYPELLKINNMVRQKLL